MNSTSAEQIRMNEVSPKSIVGMSIPAFPKAARSGAQHRRCFLHQRREDMFRYGFGVVSAM